MGGQYGIWASIISYMGNLMWVYKNLDLIILRNLLESLIYPYLLFNHKIAFHVRGSTQNYT